MHSSDIATRASFDHLRYAQLWEDADVLTEGLGDQAGGTLVSICSAGDNALAMLTLLTSANTVVQMSTEPHMRGRVMGTYASAFNGLFPYGALLAGLLVERYGAPFSFAAYAAITLIGLLALFYHFRREWHQMLMRVPGGE